LLRYGAGLGPFLYCDYWASVFNLRGVVSPFVLGDGRLSLGHFRRAVDRPRTRLPKLRYYILAFIFLPVLVPYRVVYDLMHLFRGRTERLQHPVDLVIRRFQLDLDPAEAGRVRATAGGVEVGNHLLDPETVRCEVGLFFPTYKLLIAGVLSLVFSTGVLPHLTRVDILAPLAENLSGVLYVLLVGALFAALRDPLTALVAPLPVLAFHFLWRWPDSMGGVFLISAGFVALFFLVEWFLIPRGLPPTLFLYVNEPASRAFPYRGGHAPYWLRGTHYWVWRFVSLVPGELHKFWERDWERVECWVRADGPDAGRLEWVVGDFHYRELWYDYERLVPPIARADHDRQIAARSHEGEGGSLLWVLEVDMDPVFHAPYVRGVSVIQEHGMGLGQNLRRLAGTLWSVGVRDRFRHFAAHLDELEADGTELFGDVPEHFRRLALRQIVALPWSYWRYPLGAGAAASRYLYGELEPGESIRAADPSHQIKERVTGGSPTGETPTAGATGEGVADPVSPGTAQAVASSGTRVQRGRR
jgi:hypothetical protein